MTPIDREDGTATQGLRSADLPRTASTEVRQMAAELLPLAYEELKRIAHHIRARLGGRVTMQTTVLVHESYLRLQGKKDFADSAHFLRASALAMRHALINYVDAQRAAKRGSGQAHLTLSHAESFSVESDEGLLALNDAVRRLAEEHPRLADVVECRFFAGFDEAETARALALSVRTVRRDWVKARAWLYRELHGADLSPAWPDV